jgi:hypothetical protein
MVSAQTVRHQAVLNALYSLDLQSDALTRDDHEVSADHLKCCAGCSWKFIRREVLASLILGSEVKR